MKSVKFSPGKISIYIYTVAYYSLTFIANKGDHSLDDVLQITHSSRPIAMVRAVDINHVIIT